jgi:CHAT domain-containing protein
LFEIPYVQSVSRELSISQWLLDSEFALSTRIEYFSSKPILLWINFQKSKQLRYIHLATHGTFNRHKPAWSYLLFSVPQDTAPALAKDGLLTAAECYNLKLDSDLVTLSACEIARGELKPGEGLLGLTRGLLYSGARSVLVS